jgi:hypothetical protein
MPVKQTTSFVSKDEDAQLTISSNFLEESVIFTISSPTQDFRPIYIELPVVDIEPLTHQLAAIYAELTPSEEHAEQLNLPQ